GGYSGGHGGRKRDIAAVGVRMIAAIATHSHNPRLPLTIHSLKIPQKEKKESRPMINRRTALGIIASASTIGASGITLAKEKHHLNGKDLLGDKIKQNGKHKIHTAGKVDVFAEVNNGKVVGVSAAGMQVKKVKSRQKLAETTPGLILASMQLAQRTSTTTAIGSTTLLPTTITGF